MVRKKSKSVTPLWAKRMFRVVFAITSGLTIFMAATNIVPESMKYEALLGLKALDATIYALSKTFNVKVDDPETEE